MQRTRIAKLVVVAAALGVLAAAAAAAALGSGAHTASTRSGPQQAVVKVRSTPLGRVLVDARGRTLYLFEKDAFGVSACYGACAGAWPPLLTAAAPRAGTGARASLLGATRRKDGKLQVTYAGYPLYLFVKDGKAGQTRGQDLHGFGGGWYVLDAKGLKIEDGHHGEPAEVEAEKTALGRILVDGRGRALYLYTPDTGTTSTCYGACASAWPPLLTTGKPHAGSGASASLLGTTRRTDGSLQVTYHGHPLYFFAKDARAGQASGQALGGVWYVLGSSGAALGEAASGSGGSATPSSPPATTTPDPGYGNAY